MTDQELKDIVSAVVAELEKSGVDFDYKAEQAEDDDLVFVIRGTAPNYQGVTVTWKGLLDIITAQATQAKNDAETAKNAANAILTQVQNKDKEITNFVATSKSEIETQKNESVNAVKSVYQTDLDELKGDIGDIPKFPLTVISSNHYDKTTLQIGKNINKSGTNPVTEISSSVNSLTTVSVPYGSTVMTFQIGFCVSDNSVEIVNINRAVAYDDDGNEIEGSYKESVGREYAIQPNYKTVKFSTGKSNFDESNYPHVVFSSEATDYDNYTAVRLDDSVFVREENIVSKKIASPLRLSIMTHNVAEFNLNSMMTIENAVIGWKSILSKYKTDILFVQEFSDTIGGDNNYPSNQTLYDLLFPYSYTPSNSTRAIFSKFPLENKHTFTINVNDTKRIMTCADVVISGINIRLMSVHLSPNDAGTSMESLRVSQRNAIIEEYKNSEYVIIAGDFNSSDPAFYTDFTENGYVIANHGYWGSIETLSTTSTQEYPEYVDNIITKGFFPYDITCNIEDRVTSDHYPLAENIMTIVDN